MSTTTCVDKTKATENTRSSVSKSNAPVRQRGNKQKASDSPAKEKEPTKDSQKSESGSGTESPSLSEEIAGHLLRRDHPHYGLAFARLVLQTEAVIHFSRLTRSEDAVLVDLFGAPIRMEKIVAAIKERRPTWTMPPRLYSLPIFSPGDIRRNQETERMRAGDYQHTSKDLLRTNRMPERGGVFMMHAIYYMSRIDLLRLAERVLAGFPVLSVHHYFYDLEGEIRVKGVEKDKKGELVKVLEASWKMNVSVGVSRNSLELEMAVTGNSDPYKHPYPIWLSTRCSYLKLDDGFNRLTLTWQILKTVKDASTELCELSVTTTPLQINGNQKAFGQVALGDARASWRMRQLGTVEQFRQYLRCKFYDAMCCCCVKPPDDIFAFVENMEDLSSVYLDSAGTSAGVENEINLFNRAKNHVLAKYPQMSATRTAAYVVHIQQRLLDVNGEDLACTVAPPTLSPDSACLDAIFSWHYLTQMFRAPVKMLTFERLPATCYKEEISLAKILSDIDNGNVLISPPQRSTVSSLKSKIASMYHTHCHTMNEKPPKPLVRLPIHFEKRKMCAYVPLLACGCPASAMIAVMYKSAAPKRADATNLHLFLETIPSLEKLEVPEMPDCPEASVEAGYEEYVNSLPPARRGAYVSKRKGRAWQAVANDGMKMVIKSVKRNAQDNKVMVKKEVLRNKGLGGSAVVSKMRNIVLVPAEILLMAGPAARLLGQRALELFDGFNSFKYHGIKLYMMYAPGRKASYINSVMAYHSWATHMVSADGDAQDMHNSSDLHTPVSYEFLDLLEMPARDRSVLRGLLSYMALPIGANVTKRAGTGKRQCKEAEVDMVYPNGIVSGVNLTTFTNTVVSMLRLAWLLAEAREEELEVTTPVLGRKLIFAPSGSGKSHYLKHHPAMDLVDLDDILADVYTTAYELYGENWWIEHEYDVSLTCKKEILAWLSEPGEEIGFHAGVPGIEPACWVKIPRHLHKKNLASRDRRPNLKDWDRISSARQGIDDDSRCFQSFGSALEFLAGQDKPIEEDVNPTTTDACMMARVLTIGCGDDMLGFTDFEITREEIMSNASTTNIPLDPCVVTQAWQQCPVGQTIHEFCGMQLLPSGFSYSIYRFFQKFGYSYTPENVKLDVNSALQLQGEKCMSMRGAMRSTPVLYEITEAVLKRCGTTTRGKDNHPDDWKVYLEDRETYSTPDFQEVAGMLGYSSKKLRNLLNDLVQQIETGDGKLSSPIFETILGNQAYYRM